MYIIIIDRNTTNGHSSIQVNICLDGILTNHVIR